MKVDSELILAAYLELFSYIPLATRFPYGELLSEAENLAVHFKAHRGIKGWTTLGLRTLNGNAKFTESEARYGLAARPAKAYSLTEFAKQCPATMRAVASVARISQCRRIRFMALAPGAIIPCHRDVNAQVATVIHLPISYESDCQFQTGLQRDGTCKVNTVEIPFENGVPMIVNVASFHSVKNNSKKFRYSVIVEGPPLANVTELLALATKTHQNFTISEIFARLLQIRLRNLNR